MKDFLKKAGKAIRNLFVGIINGVKKAPWIVAPLVLAIATLYVTILNKPYADVVNAEIGAIDHYALIVNGGTCFTFGMIFTIIAMVISVFVCSDNIKVRKACGYITIILLITAFLMDMMLTSSINTALANVKAKLTEKTIKCIDFVSKYTNIHTILCIVTAIITVVLIDLSASKEFARKTLVKIKRQPSIIPLVMLAICSCVFLFNLKHISNSNKMNGMGLLGFVSTLFSILVLVPMLNSYPRRQKPNIFMIVLTYVMIAAIIASDLSYRSKLIHAITIDPTYLEGASGPSMLKAKDMLLTHVILLAVTVVLNATIPLYKKLLAKINTSIELEYTETTGEVEIAED